MIEKLQQTTQWELTNEHVRTCESYFFVNRLLCLRWGFRWVRAEKEKSSTMMVKYEQYSLNNLAVYQSGLSSNSALRDHQ